MNQNVMKLPELNCLTPNEQTTFRKLVEEIAECNTAIDDLRVYEENHSTNHLLLGDEEVQRIRYEYKNRLNDVMGEIMDIAQVCASQLFVFEKKGIDAQNLFKSYSDLQPESFQDTVFYVIDNCRYVHFAQTFFREMSLQSTMNTIILSMGKIAQLGKFTGVNGEVATIDEETSNRNYVYELFHIIQDCFNLLYNMKYKYNIDIETLFEQHVEKLVRKGYCSL
ncbi:hypothetical protein CVD28_03840 [Bacillus sp. M6-12]|uniref:hypothetical protein n=1 Tax=Bacillus sp. M6-12 TaxID=2054166 RepID=UPI000C7605C2|nr:hypothetical protein [Bacillus sp. M6-12]PLS19559.1 hypothetical protein CVD28_03840 [Bacillus sp. M6-12]